MRVCSPKSTPVKNAQQKLGSLWEYLIPNNLKIWLYTFAIALFYIFHDLLDTVVLFVL